MKLVRDYYDQIIPEDELRYAEGISEYRDLLQEKLKEEIGELVRSNYADVNEYADVIEVLLTLAAINDITEDEILKARMNKAFEKGGFAKGLIWLRDGR